MSARSFKRIASAIAFAGAIILAGCETTGTGARGSASALPPAPLAEDALSQATYWGARYEEDPGDAAMAVHFGEALRHLGSTEEAIGLMTRTLYEHPNDPNVLAEYAKALVAAERGGDALQPIARAIAQRPQVWELHSLEGIAYDQIGDHANATQSYEHALQASPNNSVVLNNYALSRALAGDLEGAEALLRAAVAQPGASVQTRQNLALVMGLQGEFGEAERLARADLPPRVVENNVAYYRAMLTQPAVWSDLGMDGEAE